jgi:hypothetical protein
MNSRVVQKSADKAISLAVTQELLYCYESIIRPVFVTDSVASVGAATKIIEHYELLLAHCSRHYIDCNNIETTTNIHRVVKSLDKMHIRDGKYYYYDENGATLKIGSIIDSISQDISVSTAKITHHDIPVNHILAKHR